MDQKDINIKIKVDSSNSTKNVNTIEKSLQDLNSTLANLTKVLESTFSNLGDTIDENADSMKKMNTELEKTEQVQDNVEKSSKKTAGGLKGIASGFGAIMKASGIIGLLTMLWSIMQKNQRVMDIISKVMTIIGVVFETVTGAIMDAYEAVSQSTGGFDAMKKVIMGLITLAITPLKLNFYAIKGALLAAQLAWENSFLGGKDPQKIAELKASLNEVKEDIKQTAKDALEAGKSIGQNLGEAIGEVGSLVSAVATNVTNAVKDMNINVIASQAELLVQARKAFAELEIQQKALDLRYKQQQELQRQIRDNVNLTTEERLAANTELGRLLDEQMQKEQAVLDEKIKIAKQELSIDKDSHEKKLTLMQLQLVDQAELNERITGMKSEQIVNEQGILKEANDKKLADEKEALDKSNEQIKKNQELINEIYRKSAEDKLKTIRDTQLAELELTTLSEEEKNAAKLEIEANYQEDLKEIEDEKNAKLDEERQKKKDQDDKDREDRIKAAEEEAKAVVAIAQQMSQLISSITDLRFQNELNAMNESQKEQLDSFEGTEEERAALLEKFAKDKADLEYRQAVARKRMNIINAVIDGASAVVEALPNIPLSILAGAMALTNLGLIISTPVPPPQYARGGVLKGKSHANGGILTPFGELEGGEGVINSLSMSSPSLRNMASAANVAGGGVDYSVGDGGITLSQASIIAIASMINDKQVVLNMNELNKKQNQLTIIENESVI